MTYRIGTHRGGKMKGAGEKVEMTDSLAQSDLTHISTGKMDMESFHRNYWKR